MIRIRTLLLAVSALMALAAHGLDLRPQVDPLAMPLIDDSVAVGFVVGIIQDGQSQVIGYGETRRGSGITPDENTFYEIGSVSKVFTGVLLADMVETGAVSLKDHLQRFLPDSVPLRVNKKPITLEHLATHSSGLPRLPENMDPADSTNPYADYSEDLLYTFLRDHAPVRKPGKYEYSNLGMGLLGHVLAAREDLSYEAALMEHITKPLGMPDTRIELDDGQQARLAPPYDASLGLVNTWDLPTLAGAGGIRSTCRDLLTFLRANLDPDTPRLGPALRLSHKKIRDVEGGLGIGLGWHIAKDGQTRWHNGMTGGYASWIAFVPGYDAAVVVLSNTASPLISELGERITQVACGMTVAPPVRHELVEVPEEVLRGYVGTYAITPSFALTVSLENGQLMVQATGQERFPVYPTSPAEFFYRVVDAQLTFVPAGEGRAAGLILHQGGRDLEALRE